MKALVTGAAGFIGSSLVDRLLLEGHEVVGVDDFSTGRREFLKEATRSPRFKLVERDLLEPSSLHGSMDRSVNRVFHLAANADVRFGLERPRRDLEQNTIVTWNVLEAMRENGVKWIAFSSTGSVYGEAPVIPTPENCPFPVQTSLYGASKLAAEAMISAYAEGFGIQGRIFRFVSILGERYTHGHVFDFAKQLLKDPGHLSVLGDGQQRKSYLYVGDCISALLHSAKAEAPGRVEIYNLGTDEYVTVDQSIQVICEEMGVKPKVSHSGGDRGWVGDNPFIFLECAKMRQTGWAPTRNIRDSVRTTVKYLLENRTLLGA